MFDNEVFIKKEDKAILLKNIEEINKILNKYPYYKDGTHYHTVTAISRAKNFSKDAEQWIRLLSTED